MCDFGRKAEVKRTLGRHRCRWERNIKMDVREGGLCSINCIRLIQDRDRWKALENTAMDIRIP
jgi:hypothetical protein